MRSCSHGQERFLSAQLRVAAMNRLEKLAALPLGHPDAASRNARVEFGVGQQPLESAILLLEILQSLGLVFFGGRRAVRLLRHTDLLDRLGNGLTSSHLDFDLSQHRG